MKFLRNKKIILIIATIIVVFSVFGGTKIANAEGVVITNFAVRIVYVVAMGFNYLIGQIGGVFLTFAAGLVDIALKINTLIIESPIVATGWGIVLGITNLGFVLGIIVIAFATILRMESYAMKQTLWKLIVAALLVNFSLVIAGAFINSADILTGYFNDQFKQVSISTKLTNLLAAQTLSNPFEKDTSLKEWSISFSRFVLGGFGLDQILGVPNLSDKIYEMFSGGGKLTPDAGIEEMFPVIASMLFSVVFTFLSVLVLLTIAIMLIIRYIYLGILLVLSPIVWLLWIFPTTAGLWHNWWKKFLQWTFFAPIMMFFLFVAINTTNPQTQQLTDAQTQQRIAEGQQFVNEITQKQTGLPINIAKLGNMTIILGLLIGSLIAAQALSIAGAKQAMGAAQGASKMFGGWVGRKGLQYGTGWMRRKGPEEGAKSLAERTQEWAAKRKTTLGRFGAGWMARGVTGLATAGGEKIAKQYEQQVAKMAVPNMKAALLTATGPFRIALLNELKNKKELGDVDMTRMATKENRALFARFNRAKTFGDIEKAGVMSVEMNEARQKDDKETLLKASVDLMAKFTKKDVDTATFKEMFSGKAKLGLDKESLAALSQYIAKGVAEKNPALVANIMPKMDSTSRENFEKTYKDVIKDMPQKIRDDFDKTMANFAVGFSPVAETTTESPKT